MLKDIPYKALMENKEAYDIMLLRDQGRAYRAIVETSGLSVPRVRQIYQRLKSQQLRLYTNHLSIALGYDDTSYIEELVTSIRRCYQNQIYTCGYIEHKYNDILSKYRMGEPGVPEHVIESIPPFKPTLSEQEIGQIVKMRDNENTSFIKIGKELSITPEKARYTYKMYYDSKTIHILEYIQANIKGFDEKTNMWNFYFGKNISPKKRFESLLEDIKKKGFSLPVDLL